MATFSTNQVRQLYVVNRWNTAPAKFYDKTSGEVLSTANAGDMAVMDSRNVRTNIPELQFVSTNVDNELQITDRIPLTQIRSIRVSHPNFVINPLIGFNAFPTGGYTDGTNTVTWTAGTQLSFTITFPEFIGISPEDTFTKTVCVTYNESGTNNYINDLEHALNLAFEHEPKFDIVINKGATALDLIFKPTHFRLGIASQQFYRFWISNVHIFYLDSNNNKRNYYLSKNEIFDETHNTGLIMSNVPTQGPALDYFTTNSNNYADLEWFCMGERGDMYRMKGWPNYIETRYMVNPNHMYTSIDIHYYFKDEGVSGYPSEKIITLLVDEGEWNITEIGDQTKWEDMRVIPPYGDKWNSDNVVTALSGYFHEGFIYVH